MKLPMLKIGSLRACLPIVQGGMALRVSTAPLAAAVAEAGGIGVIGATGMLLEELREEIRQARRLTRGIVGVNIMFAARNFAQMVKVALEEKIDVIFSGAGFSRDIFQWARQAGVPVVSIVSSARLAALAEKFGAAAVVAEGNEAGGHLGTDRSLWEILPEICRAVKIPVLAAGGIVDGDGLRRALQAGASGVQMATRFVLSRECAVADAFKQVYLQAQESDVVVIPSPVGLPGRAIKNRFAGRLLVGEAARPDKCHGCLKSCSGQYCIMEALENSRCGRVEEGVVFAGQNVYRIKDILPVQTIMENLCYQYRH